MSKYCRPWNPVSANSFNMSIASYSSSQVGYAGHSESWGIHVFFPQGFMALKLTTLLTYTMH